MSSSGHVLTLAGLLFGITAAAAISPLLQSTAGASRGINLAVAKAPPPNAQTATAACKDKPGS